MTDQVGDTTVNANNASVEIDSTGGDVIATVGNGSLTIDASPGVGGSVEATVDVGSISIRVPGSFAADLSMEVNIGIVVANLFDFTVTNLRETLRTASATLNGGGGSISAEVDLGNLTFDSLP